MTSQRTRDRLVERLREQGIHHAGVLQVLSSLPRHFFIDEALAHRAYEDTALPIGLGQTISQPFVVALMTQVLLEQPRARVLEIGTGCGYQTAVLSALVERVYTVERIDALLAKARGHFGELRLRNVSTLLGDGYQGWATNAPFDGIIVTAAPPSIPDALLEQLAPGGRLVVPVGGEGAQSLTVIDRQEDGFVQHVAEQVRFVPLLQGVQKGVQGSSSDTRSQAATASKPGVRGERRGI